MGEIEGGYILLARKIINSQIMKGPPLHLKLWIWMLLKANYTENQRNGLKRGQFFASIEDMREAMSWKVGYRKHKPTKSEIRWAYETFTNSTMISRMNSTRGQVITIINYDQYQLPKNYEHHRSNTPTSTEATHYTKEGNNKVKKTNNKNGFKYEKSVPIPPDIYLTDAMIQYAADKGHNISNDVFIKDMFEAFCIHHRKKGNKFVDWHAAWQTWVRNNLKFRKSESPPPVKYWTAEKH